MPRRLAWRFAMGVTGHVGMPRHSYGDVAGNSRDCRGGYATEGRASSKARLSHAAEQVYIALCHIARR
jgi:hypothetical protein